MIHVSVSALQRSIACPASAVLPREPQPPGEAAKRGTLIHAVVAAALRGWEAPDVGRYRLRIDIAALEAYLGDGERLCELAMAYDGSAVEVLGENIGREYNRPGALCGSADIIVKRGNTAMVCDVKTGAIPSPHPRENWQIAALAAMFGMAYSHVTTVRGVIAQLYRDGSWEFTEHDYDRVALRMVRAKLDAARETWARFHDMHESGWGVEGVPGEHCRFCPVHPDACQYARATSFPASQHATV